MNKVKFFQQLENKNSQLFKVEGYLIDEIILFKKIIPNLNAIRYRYYSIKKFSQSLNLIYTKNFLDKIKINH